MAITKHTLKKITGTPLPVFLVMLLTACSSAYEVTLNEQVIYDPFPGSDSTGQGILTSAGFQACLNDRMNRSNTTDPVSLTLLVCSNAEIDSLAGISALTGLEQLELSDNHITDLSPLQQLKSLRVLSIRNNQVRDIRPLLNLPLLRFISLTGNNEIPCAQLDQLGEKAGIGLTRPAMCSQ